MICGALTTLCERKSPAVESQREEHNSPGLFEGTPDHGCQGIPSMDEETEDMFEITALLWARVRDSYHALLLFGYAQHASPSLLFLCVSHAVS